jgi:hypothetical protein
MNTITYGHLYFDEATTETEANTDTEQSKSGESKPAEAEKEKKYTDEDIDRIIEKKLAKWNKQKTAEIDEAKRLANMTAQERAEHERDALKAELDQLKHANTVAELEKTARGILQADGVTVPDTIVSALVGENAESTSENVKAFSKAFKHAVQAEVKAQLANNTPKTGAGGAGITKEDIAKEINPFKRQQLIRENMSLYGKK